MPKRSSKKKPADPARPLADPMGIVMQAVQSVTTAVAEAVNPPPPEPPPPTDLVPENPLTPEAAAFVAEAPPRRKKRGIKQPIGER